MRGGHILARDVAGPRFRCVRAFGGKPRGHPVQLAGRVVVDLAKAKALEPPRGPWRYVSSGIPAVDDHGPLVVEEADGLGFEAPEREAYRAWQMSLLVLVRRQNLDQLGASLDKFLDLIPVDLTRHLVRSPLYMCGLQVRKCLEGETRLDAHLRGDAELHVIVLERQHAAIGVVDEDDLVRPEQAL